ncbi:hypothetical protein MXB_4792, partial [Myxobolus squamalis]
MLSSGGVDGSLIHWLVGDEKELGIVESAHDGVIWELSWHPEGGILSSVSNDQSTKIWIRQKPQTLPPKNFKIEIKTDVEYDIPEALNIPEDIAEDMKTTAIEQTPTIDSIGSNSNNLIKDYPYRIHKFFACVTVQPRPRLLPERERYPIGKIYQPIVPSLEEIKEDYQYFYDKNVPIRKRSCLESVNIYDEDDDEILPVYFSKPAKIVNYLPANIVQYIMNGDYVEQPFQYDSSRVDNENLYQHYLTQTLALSLLSGRDGS